MFYVELNGYHIHEGTKKECLLIAKTVREFLDKYGYYPLPVHKISDSECSSIKADEVYSLCVCMFAINF